MNTSDKASSAAAMAQISATASGPGRGHYPSTRAPQSRRPLRYGQLQLGLVSRGDPVSKSWTLSGDQGGTPLRLGGITPALTASALIKVPSANRTPPTRLPGRDVAVEYVELQDTGAVVRNSRVAEENCAHPAAGCVEQVRPVALNVPVKFARPATTVDPV